MGAVWTIVVAAGSGERYGGLKQLEAIDGRRVLDLALEAPHEVSDAVVVVVPGHLLDELQMSFSGIRVVAGGATRSESVRAGLSAVPPAAQVIVVHDAARPLATSALFRAVIDAVRDGADGAVPALGVTDTIKQVDGPLVTATLDREVLVAVQTPQAFRAGALRSAHRFAFDATDDAALLERDGAKVVIVPGERANFKLTEPADLERVREHLRRKSEAP